MKHTKLPWHKDRAHGEPYFEIWHGHIGQIDRCRIAEYVHPDDANFIVHACNSYYDLLEACKAGFDTLEAYYDGRSDDDKCASWFKIRDAITKAEGENTQ